MKWLLVSALLVLNACAPSRHPTENVEVALVSEGTSIEPGKPFYVGIRMTMKPGWHTYWKNPGDAGLPLRAEWSLPPGFQAGPIEWPAPERIEANDLVSYGYHDVVLLPVRIQPPAGYRGHTAKIRAGLHWLECEEVCVPGSDTVEVSIPVRRDPARSRWAPEFAATRARMPAAPTGWSFTAESSESTITLAFQPPAGIPVDAATFFPDSTLVVEYAAPQRLETSGDQRRLTLVVASSAPAAPERLIGVLAVEGASNKTARKSVQIDVPVSRAAASAGAAGSP